MCSRHIFNLRVTLTEGFHSIACAVLMFCLLNTSGASCLHTFCDEQNKVDIDCHP